jgi:AraC family transcriptional regulator of adaptative response / DNA-3-methyladenine glycosylase II
MYFHSSHQVGNLERFEADKMQRIVECGGKVGIVTISNDAKNSRLIVDVKVSDSTMIQMIISRVRALFDLDCDPLLIVNSLEVDPQMKRLLKKYPGIRLPSGWDGFEVAVSAILGQLVSVKHGRVLVTDLIELLGSDSGLMMDGKSIKLFPTPKQIAASNLSGVKTTAARKQTLINFSKALVEKRLSLEPTQNVDEFLEKVTSIRGIGPWTAKYMALKALRHTDAFPDTDLIIARALEFHPKATIDRMSPWRGYVAALLWREYAPTLKKIAGGKNVAQTV